MEDNEVHRVGLATTLRSEGFMADEAGTGKQALERMRAHAPNLILLDMFLPDIDGWSLMDQIRSNADWSAIPVVIVTGLSVGSREWSLALGAIDFVRKPFEFAELIQKIRKYCDG